MASLFLGEIKAKYPIFLFGKEISLLNARDYPMQETTKRILLHSSISETHVPQQTTYFNSGRFLTLVAISDASGHSFSTSSKGPKNDLFCPIKVFFTTGVYREVCDENRQASTSKLPHFTSPYQLLIHQQKWGIKKKNKMTV